MWDEDRCWYRTVLERMEDDIGVVTFTEFGNGASCTLEYVKDPFLVRISFLILALKVHKPYISHQIAEVVLLAAYLPWIKRR